MFDPTNPLGYALNRLSEALGAAQKVLRRFGKTTVGASLGAASFVKVQRRARLMLTEIVGAYLVLLGVSYWSLPSALIVGGLALVAAVEIRA